MPKKSLVFGLIALVLFGSGLLTGRLISGEGRAEPRSPSSAPTVVTQAATVRVPDSARTSTGGIVRPVGGGPFLRGVKVSLSQAQAEVSYTLVRPNSPAAADSSISAVWVEQGSGFSHVGIDYASGIEEIVQPVPFSADSASEFNTLQGELSQSIGKAASVQTVQGGPALVVDENAQGNNPGSVGFVMNGLYVEIYGPFDRSSLIAVANSVR